eukprot:9155043-Ditylum_brightwellii.AAC.1
MTDALHDMDADVLVSRMKAKQYHEPRVPIQNNGHNCGVYVLCYATCKACHSPMMSTSMLISLGE